MEWKTNFVPHSSCLRCEILPIKNLSILSYHSFTLTSSLLSNSLILFSSIYVWSSSIHVCFLLMSAIVPLWSLWVVVRSTFTLCIGYTDRSSIWIIKIANQYSFIYFNYFINNYFNTFIYFKIYGKLTMLFNYFINKYINIFIYLK